MGGVMLVSLAAPTGDGRIEPEATESDPGNGTSEKL
jgi:hypothetical protein